MSFTRACLSASVRPSLSFVCLCATFSPVNNISCPLCVALECDNSCRYRLPLCSVDSPLTRHATAPRTSLRWNDNYIRRRRRATFTLACRNLPAALLVLLLPSCCRLVLTASSLLVGFSCKIAHMSYVISVACPCVAIAIACAALRATK